MAGFGTFKPTNFRYLTGQMLDAGAAANSFMGGIVNQMIANVALNFGDLVQVTATALGVSKLTTTPFNTIGAVVGGLSTNGEILTDSTLVGTSLGACTTAAGQSVLVQRSGVVQVLTDASAVLIGSLIAPSTGTAGSAALLAAASLNVATGANTLPCIGWSMTANGSAAVPIVLYMKGLI